MSRQDEEAFRRRIDAVRDRVDIAAVIGGAIRLSRGSRPRGQCPFHGSKSDSLAVYPDTGRAKCWGCPWTGDAIKFVQDYYGIAFLEALTKLEGDAGLDAGGLAGLTAAPVAVERKPFERRDRAVVDSITMGRWLWKHGKAKPEAVRTYFRARGVPEAVLGDHRLSEIRFLQAAPIAAWPENRSPKSMPSAPAIVALVRRVEDWRPIGVHVTFLAPDLAGKMERQRADGSTYPARKMLGPVGGGAVIFPGAGSAELTATGGTIDPLVPIYEGEGLETTLSGMAMDSASAAACGLAALSLDNLQGDPMLVRGALPLYDPRPDPARRRALTFAHKGPVTGLIDADMKPLRGPIDRRTGEARGMPVIERRGGPIVHRAVTTAERAALCAALFVHAWRAEGCRARAVRPRMGRDFNDAIREGQ